MAVIDIQRKLGFCPIKWGNGKIQILDQRDLPNKENYTALGTIDDVAKAIADLAIRGAPLIGIAAAYALCLVGDPQDQKEFSEGCRRLVGIRPTAVNLRWAVERMADFRSRNLQSANLRDSLIGEAQRIHAEDAEMCTRIGEIGNSIVPPKARILTHCNAGALATGGIGTALGVIYTAHFAGKRVDVWVDETRPVLQGARLTAWELSKAAVPYRLIADNAAGHLMAEGKVDLVITGADRVAANLDFANKIGTYSLAVLAKHHGIPFYAAAPSSTFDPACPDGRSIVIEQRPASEVTTMGERWLAPKDTPAYNPAFDITPHELVTGVITEKGILRP